MSELSSSNTRPAPAPEPAAYIDAILRLLDRPVVAAELDAGADQASRPAESMCTQSIRILLFRVGEETAALPAKALRRVAPVARASPIPHRTTGVFRGVCNIRGELVLCADLHRLLGLPARDAAAADAQASSDRQCMVVVGPADNSWAFEVDALMGVENVDSAQFRAPPVTVEYSIGDFTLGVADLGGRCVTILDGERILAGFKAGLA